MRVVYAQIMKQERVSNNGISNGKKYTQKIPSLSVLTWNKTQAMRWRETTRFGAELKRVITRKYL